MDFSDIENKLDAFLPRMVVRIDKLGRYERDYSKVFNICQNALLKKGYEIVVDENAYTIEVGKLF